MEKQQSEEGVTYDDIEKDLRKIENLRDQSEKLRKQVREREEEYNQQCKEALYVVEELEDRWYGDQQLQALLQEQRECLWGFQRNSVEFLDESIKEFNEERRLLDEWQEECQDQKRKLKAESKKEN